ncbi:MAG TPA: TaqI-like C-terminal specificity domain-containing protein [Acidiferrobacter sp.]|nr:TaqI-like C-terminal specificity domain-containing protein [Acidiferrobacter sp.]
MAAPREIVDLVNRFNEHVDDYRSGKYNETQLRRDYLDPFLRALGWDVDNSQGHAEAYREVVHEDAVKIGGNTKSPDYSCRVGGTRKFFVEAKKPSVDIKNDTGPAFQLRRYAWSAKLPLSILTDFEEFAVYDCRVRPNQNDKASTARIHYWTYRDYLDKWDGIAAIFSKEAVLKGSFDRYAATAKGKKGTTEVDAVFLDEIEDWREALAKDIARNNEKISQHELNWSVQQTIDRIIFLRIAEDRGLEPYGQLQALQNGNNVYARIQELFHKADDRYNSGLFHFKKEPNRSEEPDRLTTALVVEDKILKDIFKHLYYPDSPYEFSVLGADILGSVYERFLGKVIRLTDGHRAKVEEKPAVKKAGGVFYTPTYIVQYIVQRTIGKLLEGKAPKDAEKLRIVDPACGSGSFLIGAYQYLLDWHRDWYITDGAEKHAKGRNPKLHQGRGGAWRLTTTERKRILVTNLYGVDIDSQAVEVTKLSLLLKVLEGETQLEIFHERVLPDLGSNIKCGNSLIGSDFYDGQLDLDDEIAQRINIFDWRAAFPEVFEEGGFDTVIGNPPWGAEFGERDLQYMVNKYPQVPTKIKDSYFYFIYRAIEITRKDGLLGFIVPNTWLLINTAKPIREDLLSYKIEEIRDYGDGVFNKATVESSTLILRKHKDENGECHAVRLRKGAIIVTHDVPKSIWLSDISSRIIIDMNREVHLLLKKLSERSDAFNSQCTITWGIKPYQVGYGQPPQTRDMLQSRIYHSDKKRGADWKPLLVGTDVNRYQIHFPGDQFIKYGKWLMYPSNQSLMVSPKILMRQTSDTLRCCYDNDGFYCQNSVFIVHSTNVPLKLLLALLNSRLMGFIYKLNNPQTGKVFAEIKPSVIKELPIFDITKADAYQKSVCDKIVMMVERMLTLHKQVSTASTPHEQEGLKRQIEATDRQIDKLVYGLYGLTDEEIKFVECSA